MIKLSGVCASKYNSKIGKTFLVIVSSTGAMYRVLLKRDTDIQGIQIGKYVEVECSSYVIDRTGQSVLFIQKS